MKKLLVVAAFALNTAGLSAEESHPFQASLTPDIAIYQKQSAIQRIQQARVAARQFA